MECVSHSFHPFHLLPMQRGKAGQLWTNYSFGKKMQHIFALRFISNTMPTNQKEK